uniref:Uncharacterized protein n=1 Tax=Anguilla anguilla TaxID=7936 RepID=A0A0E9WB15_ANGAN
MKAKSLFEVSSLGFLINIWINLYLAAIIVATVQGMTSHALAFI